MKELDQIIDSPKGFAGYKFVQRYKDDKYYIYEQIRHDNNQTIGFQSFEKRINTQFNCESWPGPEATNAFQHWTYEEALTKINKLKNEQGN